MGTYPSSPPPSMADPAPSPPSFPNDEQHKILSTRISMFRNLLLLNPEQCSSNFFTLLCYAIVAALRDVPKECDSKEHKTFVQNTHWAIYEVSLEFDVVLQLVKEDLDKISAQQDLLNEKNGIEKSSNKKCIVPMELGSSKNVRTFIASLPEDTAECVAGVLTRIAESGCIKSMDLTEMEIDKISEELEYYMDKCKKKKQAR